MWCRTQALSSEVAPLAVEGDSVWADGDVDGAIDSLLFGDQGDDDDLQDQPLSKRAKHAAKKKQEAVCFDKQRIFLCFWGVGEG